jgi:hypothetical protein
MIFRKFCAAALLLCGLVIANAALAADGQTSSSEISRLLRREDVLNDMCRDGPGNDPKTKGICEQRDATVERLKSLGWCYGDPGQAGYQMVWHRCAGGAGPAPASAARQVRGACTKASSTFEGPLRGDVNSRQRAPFACNSATITFLDLDKSVLMVQIGMAGAPRDQLLTFIGIMEGDGVVMDIYRAYVKSEKYVVPTVGSCKFSTANNRLTSLSCGVSGLIPDKATAFEARATMTNIVNK